MVLPEAAVVRTTRTDAAMSELTLARYGPTSLSAYPVRRTVGLARLACLYARPETELSHHENIREVSRCCLSSCHNRYNGADYTGSNQLQLYLIEVVKHTLPLIDCDFNETKRINSRLPTDYPERSLVITIKHYFQHGIEFY